MISPATHAGPEVLTGASPVDVIRAWPADVPLAVLRDGPRWTLLASPSETVIRRVPEGALPPRAAGGLGWLGTIMYEAGAAFEPASGNARTGTLLAVWRRCDWGLLHDARSGRWFGRGEIEPIGTPSPARVGNLVSIEGRSAYVDGVRHVIECIRAGDVYQVNLAHRLTAGFSGSARTLFADMLGASEARHGAYLEWDDGDHHVIASASPELFVRVDPHGLVTTRPMKGTGLASSGTLASSPKDQAELNMIVDLMRNDLGRVCRFGSVRVQQARTIETHGVGPGALHQGVATVTGRMRDGLGLDDLLRATFPGGSITGAPKIRAMQLIRELEGCERGAFCGAIGLIGDDGTAQLGIGIRTASITGIARAPGMLDDATLTYPVGAGIVVDSDPEAEWLETMHKSRVLRDALDGVERVT